MKKRLMIIGMLCAIVICTVGATYAFFSYTKTSEKSEVITGEIYMNYEETKNIYLTNVFPETKASALARTDEKGVFEFSITGRNTSEYPIYYEIDILEGEVLTSNGEVIQEAKRVLPEHVMIYLERDGEVLVDGMTFKEWNNRRIWVETIPAGTKENISHNYTLRMWIDEDVTISDTDPFADYTTSEWNDSYASLKVRVIGNLEEKTTPYDYMARLGSGLNFWGTSIGAQRSNITEVNFIQMSQNEIDAKMNDETITIKEDVTDTTKGGSVSAWLEVDSTDATKYIMYVASDGTTYFPSNCTQIFIMFKNLKEINFDNIDTSNVTNMSGMFSRCGSLMELDLSGFDTSNVTNMETMFYGCSSLTELDVSGFDTSSVTNMIAVFQGCSSLTKIDVSGFDTRNVTNMLGMFSKCSSLTEIDVNSFDTSNVKNMGSMFSYCTSLTKIDVSGFDTSNVRVMGLLFADCSSLTEIDVSSFNTSNVTNMQGMFEGCSSLATIYANTDWNVNNLTEIPKEFSSIFDGCTSLVGAVPFDSTKTDITMANPDTGYFTKKEA